MALWIAPARAQDLAQDTLTIRILLDVNGLSSTSVFEVAEMDPALARVTALRLDGLDLTTLPPEIAALDKLKYLSLADNGLDSLPDALWDLRDLVSLDLRGNLLTGLDARVGRLGSLLFLGLGGNALSALPHLEDLLLAGNAVDTLPEAVADLVFLKYLDLSGNALRALPFAIAALGLDSLDLADNALADLPPSVLEMPAATRVRLVGNRLCALDPSLAAWADGKDPAWRSTQSCGSPVRPPRTRAPRGPALRAWSRAGSLRLDWTGWEGGTGARSVSLRDAAGRLAFRCAVPPGAGGISLPRPAAGFLWAELRTGDRLIARSAVAP